MKKCRALLFCRIQTLFILLVTAQAQTLTLPVTYRDFTGGVDGYSCYGYAVAGMVDSALGSDRKPVVLPDKASPALTPQQFYEWYHDSPNSARYCRDLTFTTSGNGYLFDDPLFFPLDDVPSAVFDRCDDDGQMHNFGFSMELHTTFRYKGGERFSFTGDDDVYIFINNRLSFDLKVTGFAGGSIDLDSLSSTLGIYRGMYYNLDIFYREGCPRQSHLKVNTTIDMLPPPPPGVYIADPHMNVIPQNDTITLNQNAGSQTFYSLEIRQADTILDCNPITVEHKTLVSGNWNLGSTASTGTSFVVDPAALTPGYYRLALASGSYFDTIALKIELPQTLPVVFNPPSMYYCGSLDVSLSTATPGAAIYWSTDGGDSASKTWHPYTGPIRVSDISENVTIYAVASKGAGWQNSIMTHALYSHSREPFPEIRATPSAGHDTIEYWPTLDSVTLRDGDAEASLYYIFRQTDRFDTSTWIKYTPGTNLFPLFPSVPADSLVYLSVIAVKAGCLNSWVNHAKFLKIIPRAGTPIPNPWGGIYTAPIDTIWLNPTTPGSTIWYSWSNLPFDTTKWLRYDSVTTWLSLTRGDHTDTLYYAATALNYRPSYVGRQIYILRPFKTANPTATPPAGDYTAPVNNIRFASATAGARIFYTTATDAFDSTKWSVFDSQHPLSVTATTTFRVIAVKAGWQNSDIVPFIYAMVQPKASAPIITPGAGTYAAPISAISMTDTTADAQIYYTFGRASFDTSVWTRYDAAHRPSLAVSDTLRAIAVAPNRSPSNIVTVVYTIILPRAGTPTATPESGAYPGALDAITLTDTTAGVAIYYTFGSSDFTATGWTRYDSAHAPACFTSASLRAIAVKSGYQNSYVATFTYVINAIPTIAVSCVSTHEWAPHTGTAGDFSNLGNSLSVHSVLKEVFGVSDADLAGVYANSSAALSFLAGNGYPERLDGYLDYVDVLFSEPITLDASCIRSLDCALSGAGMVRQWTLRKIITNNNGLSYRLWLEPTFFGKPAGYSDTLETGMKLTVDFDNAMVAVLNNGKRIGDSSAIYVTPIPLAQDSAAPLISGYLSEDNTCQRGKASTLTVFFSEPVRKPAVVGLANLSTAFIRVDPGMNSPVTRASLLDGIFTDITEKSETLVPLYADNMAPGLTPAYCLIVNPDSMGIFKEKVSSIRLNSGALPNEAVSDARGNSGLGNENAPAVLSVSSVADGVACNLTLITQTNRADAQFYSWTVDADGGMVPLFPWWGGTFLNPLRNDITRRPPDIHLNVYIYDLLGNLVADPSRNASLRVTFDADALFGNGDGTYKKSADFGIQELLKCRTAGMRSGCGPAWNCLNKKGRLVAPGGYIVRRIIDNGINPSVELMEKLVVTDHRRRGL